MDALDRALNPEAVRVAELERENRKLREENDLLAAKLALEKHRRLLAEYTIADLRTRGGCR